MSPSVVVCDWNGTLIRYRDERPLLESLAVELAGASLPSHPLRTLRIARARRPLQALYAAGRRDDDFDFVTEMFRIYNERVVRGVPVDLIHRCMQRFAQSIPAQQALDHPTWKMGTKITIDSATMMNKGFEVIEARWLFDVPMENIDVVIHPQSIVHSLVEFVDGSVKAQLGLPDMRLPIQYAMFYPERPPSELPRLDISSMGRLTFEAPDLEKYPCLKLALEAGRRNGTYPAVLSAADDIAVDLFLQGRIDRACPHPATDYRLQRCWGRKS